MTVDLVETKYQQWAEGSAQATSEMTWTEKAKARMERIPDLVRGMAVKAIEAHAQEQGLTEVTPRLVEEEEIERLCFYHLVYVGRGRHKSRIALEPH